MNGKAPLLLSLLLVAATVLLQPEPVLAQTCDTSQFHMNFSGTIYALGETDYGALGVNLLGPGAPADALGGWQIWTGPWPGGSASYYLAAGSTIGHYTFVGGAPGYRPSWSQGADCVPVPGCTGGNGTCDGTFTILLYPYYVEDPAIRPVGSCNAGGPGNVGGSGSGSGNAGGPGNVGEPVNVLTGNVWLDQADVAIPGVSSELRLTRSYNSMNAHRGIAGAFGRGWTATYDRSLSFPEPKVIALRGADGVPLYFEDFDSDLTFKAWLPQTEQSWIVNEGATYVRIFRAGGSETYDSAGRLMSITDAAENTTTISRDGQARVATVTDPGSRWLSFTYGAGSRVSSVSGPAGLVASYTYDASGFLSAVSYPDGSGFQFTYDGWADLLTVADFSGRTLETHTYDATTARGLTSEVSQGQEKLTLTYYSGKTVVTDALGNQTTYTWDEIAGLRRVIRVDGPCSSCGGGGGQSEGWAYDSRGNVLSHTDGLGNTTTYTYDPNTDDKLTETDPLGKKTTYTYDPQGRVLTRTDALSGQTTYVHGPAGPTSITEKITASTTRTTGIHYTAQGKPDQITDPRGKITTLTHNGFGDLASSSDPLEQTDPGHHTTTYQYNNVGRRTDVTDPLGNTTHTDYDARGRVTRVTNPAPDLTHTDFTYDLGGRRKTVKDALNCTTTYDYDAYGRLQKVTDCNSPPGVTTYEYDIMSHLTAIKDARGQTTGKKTTFTYDAYGHVTKVTYPSTKFETFTYDAAGRLATKKDRRNITTTYTYDADGRLTGKSYSSGGSAVSSGYDAVGHQTSAGNLTWQYDLAGQISQAAKTGGLTLTYTYDANGNRTGLQGTRYPFSYVYDDANRLTTISYATFPAGPRTFTLNYDNDSRRTALNFPNGVNTSYAYDTLSRLTSIGAVKGTTVITQTGYTYDAVGNRVTKTLPGVNEGYGYDPIYRLTGVLQNSSTTEAYGYDPVGNRLSSLTLPNWTYDDDNRLLSNGSATFTYDGNGNLTQKVEAGVAWTYTWDAENRLLSVKKGAAVQASYTYDALGRRASRTAGGATTTYDYDGAAIIRETTTGSVQKVWIHGPGIDEPLAYDDGSLDGAGHILLTSYHADGLGSILKVTSASGTVTSSRQYDAFGGSAAAVPIGYAFTGREWDPAAGLYYYRARYYDPKIGRFISEDPIPSVNLYTYVADNPIRFTDPTGQCGIEPCNTAANSLIAYHCKCQKQKTKDDVCWCMCIYAADQQACVNSCKGCSYSNWKQICECACKGIEDAAIRRACLASCKL